LAMAPHWAGQPSRRASAWTEEEFRVTYIIAQPCVDLLDKSCIEECPVDCIYEGERMLYIISTSAWTAAPASRSARWKPSTNTTCPIMEGLLKRTSSSSTTSLAWAGRQDRQDHKDHPLIAALPRRSSPDPGQPAASVPWDAIEPAKAAAAAHPAGSWTVHRHPSGSTLSRCRAGRARVGIGSPGYHGRRRDAALREAAARGWRAATA